MEPNTTEDDVETEEDQKEKSIDDQFTEACQSGDSQLLRRLCEQDPSLVRRPFWWKYGSTHLCKSQPRRLLCGAVGGGS